MGDWVVKRPKVDHAGDPNGRPNYIKSSSVKDCPLLPSKNSHIRKVKGNNAHNKKVRTNPYVRGGSSPDRMISYHTYSTALSCTTLLCTSLPQAQVQHERRNPLPPSHPPSPSALEVWHEDRDKNYIIKVISPRSPH